VEESRNERDKMYSIYEDKEAFSHLLRANPLFEQRVFVTVFQIAAHGITRHRSRITRKLRGFGEAGRALIARSIWKRNQIPDLRLLINGSQRGTYVLMPPALAVVFSHT
jgi:hypothetical protein